jgi:hypothetical protein
MNGETVTIGRTGAFLEDYETKEITLTLAGD